jgi:HlyD family secretion protein
MNPTPLNQPGPARRNHDNRHSRRWLPYLGVLALAAVITIGLWPRPTPVETARVATGSLRAAISEEGKTRIQQRYTVSAPVTGMLRRIPFKAGAEIQAGQTVLAVIDPQSPAPLDARQRAMVESRRAAAAATFEKARAAHKFAVSELRRAEKMHADKTINDQELEAAQMRETTAGKEISAAEGEVLQMDAALGEYAASGDGATNVLRAPTEIKSPVSGRVLRVLEESARMVNAGTPLLVLGDPADMEVVIEVLSRDGAAITPGTKMDLEQWGGEVPLQARVRMVEPAAFTKVSALGVEEQRVNVVADIITPLEQRRNLGDHFRVEAKIITWEQEGVLKAPAGALFRRGNQWAVFVVVDGYSRLRNVRAGRSSGTETQILDGLSAGEEIILYPGDRVKDGVRVRPIKL